MRSSLRKKILIGYGAVLVLTTFVLVWAIVNLMSLGLASEAILNENYKSILAAENMIDAVERQDSSVLLLLLGFEKQGREQFRDNEVQFIEWLGRARDNVTIEGEKDLIEKIDKLYSEFLIKYSELIKEQKTESFHSSSFYQDSILPVFSSLRDSCIQLRLVNEDTMFSASEHARTIAIRAISSMSIFGFIAILFGLGFSLVLSSLLVRPIRAAVSATQQISKGNYDVTIPSESSDELGLLAVEFNSMVRKIKDFRDLNIGKIFAEKQKSETIIQNIEDGIVVIGADLAVNEMNPAAAKILNVDSGFAIGKHNLEIFRNERMFELIKNTIRTGKMPEMEPGKNIVTVKQDQQRYHFQFSITPMRTPEDEMLGVILLFRDVTGLKKLDQMKSEFVMVASHELRTPLTSIGLSIDLLMENAIDVLNKKQKELLLAAHEDVERLKKLISDLLDLSKIEAGKIDLDFEIVDIRLLFKKITAAFKHQVEDLRIELSYEIVNTVPSVNADPNKLTWVINNLISNAMKYTGQGGSIVLKAEMHGKFVHVSVKDDGIGIPLEYQSKIFDKFVQIKNKDQVGGSGLGLAISKEIIRVHGGSIWVESEPGQGSVFTFSIPVNK